MQSKKKKITYIAIIVVLFSLLMTGCSKSVLKKTGEQVIPGDITTDDLEGSFVMHEIKKPLPPSTLNIKKSSPGEHVPSPYIYSFPAIKQEMYKELFTTVTMRGSTYIPSYELSELELRHMMRIILLDEPLGYALSKSYSYEVDNENNIISVSLSYDTIMDTEKGQDILAKLDSSISRNERKEEQVFAKSIFSNTNYPVTDTLAADDFVKYNLNGEAPKDLVNKAIFHDSYFSFPLFKKGSEESIAKYFNYYMRNNGLSSIAIYGERTSDINCEKVSVKNFSGLKETAQENGNKRSITVDSSGLNVWNMVQISDNWYHVDYPLSQSINYNIDKHLGESSLYSKLFGFAVPDTISSLTKLSHHNEEVLGVYPMSYDNTFNGDKKLASLYVPAMTENLLESFLNDNIPGLFESAGRVSMFTLAFESPENYQYYSVVSSVLVEKYKKQGLTSLRSYDMILVPELQIIVYYNIKK